MHLSPFLLSRRHYFCLHVKLFKRYEPFSPTVRNKIWLQLEERKSVLPSTTQCLWKSEVVSRRFRGACYLHTADVKHRKTSTRLHGAPAQNTAVFIQNHGLSEKYLTGVQASCQCNLVAAYRFLLNHPTTGYHKQLPRDCTFNR
jgi:hypothetical protein